MAAGLATGIGATWTTLTADAVTLGALLQLLVGWSFLASGTVGTAHRPDNRVGPMMVMIGLLWAATAMLKAADSSLLFTAGLWLGDLWLGLFVALLVAFPFGRIVARVDLTLVGAILVVLVPLELLWLCFLPFPDGVPDNAALVWPSETTASAIDWAQRVILIAALSWLSVRLARRWWNASGPLRRALAPVLVGAVAVGMLAASYLLDKLAVRTTTFVYLDAIILTAIPLVFLIGMLRARLARSALGELLVELRTPAVPGALRDALARALRDPALELAYWVPEYRVYVGSAGDPVELPAEGAASVATLVERGGEPVAALIHDASLRDEPELVGAVTSAAGIALENERLQADLRARLGDLRASRARIVEAGDSARRQLERDLHDGAQQRLVSLSIVLRLLAGRVSADGPEAQLLQTARDELAAGLDELRRLAQGIHPAVLCDHGLAIALEALAARAPLRVALDVGVAGRLPLPVEVAAYYLVAEGLTNVAKYANAQSAGVSLDHSGGALVVQVADDGQGGADPMGGSGLRGLADRVEALDGHLQVWSPPGGGTRLRAEIPCA